MNYAIIGCGRIAAKHIEAALYNHLNIIAVCDVSEAAMDRLLSEQGLDSTNIKRYTDYKIMLEKNKIDLIAISSVSGARAGIAKDCLIAGVNLIIEKPMALSIRDADEIIRLSEENNCKVTVCHQNRLYSSVQSVKKAVEYSMLGKVSHAAVHIRWNRGIDYYSQASWRGTWVMDGGMLLNQCIHCIDMLCWLMGDTISEVYGVTKNQFHTGIETEDVALAVVKFKNGAVAIIEGTTNIYPKNLEETIYIFGQNGTVKLGGKNTNTIEHWEVAGHETPPDVSFPFGTGHKGVYADVIDAIQNNRQPYIGVEAGRNAVELILAIYKSQKEGKPVGLPLMDFATIDMKEAI